MLPARQPRVAPYIYSPEEIVAVMLAARSLRWPLRAAAFETVIGLIASTGLRLREALALDRDDVDLGDGVLLVGKARHNQQREVALHPTATAALERYSELRDRLCPNPTTPAFFITARGQRTRRPHTDYDITEPPVVRRSIGICSGRAWRRCDRRRIIRPLFLSEPLAPPGLKQQTVDMLRWVAIVMPGGGYGPLGAVLRLPILVLEAGGADTVVVEYPQGDQQRCATLEELVQAASPQVHGR